mgnify:CR=1 FL=1
MIKGYGEWLNESTVAQLTPEQVEWCNKHIKKKWKLDKNGEVVVAGNLVLQDIDDAKLPVKFADFKGNWWITRKLVTNAISC